MTNFTKNLMLAMAACTIAAGSAAAQTFQAQVPFTFRAGNTVLAPGSYRLKLGGSSGLALVQIYGEDTRQGVMLISAGVSGEQKGPAGLKLRFECAGANCALASMWIGGREGAVLFHKPKWTGEQTARVVDLDLRPAKAD